MRVAGRARRLFARDDHYPHCLRDRRPALAESAVRFRCPDNHATITLPVESRPTGVKQLLRLFTLGPREHWSV